jgi:hypothetical protein
MTEIEKTEGEIKVLRAKLELLKEMEKHRSPAEEAFKEVYGYYPEVCERSVWVPFQKGYEEAQKDYKVGEFQPILQEPEDSEWKSVALRFGRKLPVILPYSYDELSPDAWFRWAVFTYGKEQQKEPKPMDDVIDRLLEKYKSQKLWNMVRNELGYSIDCCDESVDLVEKWLPKEQSAEGSQNVDTELLVDGFNDCLKKIKDGLG